MRNKLISMIIIVCYAMLSFTNSLAYANGTNKILSATERLKNISELDDSFRQRDGWSSIILGMISLSAGIFLCNTGASNNSGGINFGGGVVYASGLIMGGIGGLFAFGGLSKLYLQKSETELNYEKVIKLDLDKMEKSAKEYLIMRDSQIKKYGLNESFIFPDYRKLYLNEINGYLLDHSGEN